MIAREIIRLEAEQFPPLLKEIPDPPAELYLLGSLPEEVVWLSVVGSRRYSTYGQDVCRQLISGLASYPICIVSGLALGIDSIAHEAALEAGLPTVAVPGSGLKEEVLYPASHRQLARRIVASGGALLSEMAPDERASKWSFPRRNRIMAGLSQAVLVIEASERSGTLITARLATEYNRDVLAVPGSIFSSGSAGPNGLIAQGACPITSASDVAEALGLKPIELPPAERPDLSASEKLVWSHLEMPLARDQLEVKTGLELGQLQVTLTALELKGLVTITADKVSRASQI